jgi:hypothetical protein
MSKRIVSRHEIHVPAPIELCHRFFTPAGEEIWVDGWAPQYIVPVDGRTELGMVFTTGSGDEFTIWGLTDFDPQTFYSRYTRVTPALRTGTVEVRCKPIDAQLTTVEITYTLTALTLAGEAALRAFEGRAFVDMVEHWQSAIALCLPQLLSRKIR